MIIYILDRSMTIIGSASTNLPDSWHLTSDDRVDELSAGVATFNFTVTYEQSRRVEAEELFYPGNYILRQNKDLDQYEYYTIIDAESDNLEGTTECYCEDAGMDLLNEVVPAFSGKSTQQGQPDKYYTCKQLIGDTMVNNGTSGVWDTGFEIGTFTVDENRKVVPDYQEETAASRVLNIANDFDADIYYTFTVSGNRITHKYINIVEHRGADNPSVLRFKHEVKSIKTKISVADLVTAVKVTGGTISVKTKNGEQQQTVTLNGMKYDDGDIYLEGTILSSRSATKKYSRYLAASEPKKIDGHIGRIIGSINSSLTDKQQLLNYAISELKRRMVPTYSYTIDLYDNTDMSLYKVGDTIKIVDDEGKTYLSARIQKTEISYTDGIVKLELGEFKQLSSGISDQLEQLAAKVGQQLNTMPVYTWIAYADDASGTNLSKSPQKSEQEYFQYIGISPNHVSIDYDASTVDPSDFTWTKVKGDQGVPGVGADGKTYYIHIAYADSDTGYQNFSVDDSTGRSYMGVFDDLIQSDPTPTDADLTRFSKYKWSLIKGRSAYIHIKYSTSDNGANMQDTPIPGEINYIGIANTSGPTAPSNAAEYNWSQFTGDTGPQGASVKGDDGKTYYIHIAYANSEDGTVGYSVQDPTGRSYMGCFTDLVQDDPTSISDERFKLYKWSKIQADQIYIHLAYSTSEDGKDNFSKTPFDGCTYQGIYSDTNKDGTDDYTKYNWYRCKGEQGDQGLPGIDGRSSYIHIKYSSVENPTDDDITETPSEYIGVCIDYTENDPTTASSYTWSKFVGKDGPQGIQGPPGDDGKTSYVHFAYATSADGKTDFSTSEFPTATYLGVLTNFKEDDSETYTDYTWSKIKGEQGIQGIQGEQGIQGPPGDDGKTTYVHFKYSSVAQPNDSQITETPSAYIGVCTDFNEKDPTTASSYTWSKFEGQDGDQGIQGPPGNDGKTSYVHIAYATSEDGKDNFSTTSFTGAIYLGTYTNFVKDDSKVYTDYHWTKIKGEQGIQGIQGIQGEQGIKGDDGLTSYLHIAYANSEDGKTDFTVDDSKSEGKLYIGQYTDHTQDDSTDPTKYHWTKIKGETGQTGPQGIPGETGPQGPTGPRGKTGSAVTGNQYYLSSSATGQAGGSWSDSVPAYKSGYYYWIRQKIQDSETGEITYTTPAIDLGLTSANQNASSSVKSIKTQYYISASDTTQEGGEWKYVVDIIVNGDEDTTDVVANKYIWSRTEMTLTDDSIIYSDPVLQNDINDLYRKQVQNYHMITQNDESYQSQFESISNVTDKLAEDISDNSTAIDNVNDKTNQNTTDISTLKQTSNSISATVQQMQDSVDSLRSANAKLTYEGLTVQTQDSNKEGKSQSLINSDGLTVRGYDVNTGKYDKTIARFTQNESILNSATVQDHMDIGGVRIRGYDDYEYDGKTKHTGAGFFWTGGKTS